MKLSRQYKQARFGVEGWDGGAESNFVLINQCGTARYRYLIASLNCGKYCSTEKISYIFYFYVRTYSHLQHLNYLYLQVHAPLIQTNSHWASTPGSASNSSYLLFLPLWTFPPMSMPFILRGEHTCSLSVILLYSWFEINGKRLKFYGVHLCSQVPPLHRQVTFNMNHIKVFGWYGLNDFYYLCTSMYA